MGIVSYGAPKYNKKQYNMKRKTIPVGVLPPLPADTFPEIFTQIFNLFIYFSAAVLQ